METNDIRKMQQLLKTATESIKEAMAIAKKPLGDDPRKRKIYVTQQRAKGCIGDDGWSTLFADTNSAAANEWVNRRNSEDALIPLEYRVKTIDLYIDW